MDASETLGAMLARRGFGGPVGLFTYDGRKL